MAAKNNTLLPIYEQAIAEGLTKEQALQKIYQAGKDTYRNSNAPFYEHNSLLQPFIFAAVMEQKYNRDEISDQTHIATLNIIYLTTNVHGNHKENPSELCNYATISNLMKFPRSQLARILKSLRVKGYIHRYKGKDESVEWKLKANKQHYYYTLTDKGLKFVKQFGKLAHTKYKSFINPGILENFSTYNFASNILEQKRHMFNAHRERFEYNNPSNQKLGLIVKDFKKRYPPKTEQNNKKF